MSARRQTNYIYFTVTATIDNYKRIRDTKLKTKRNQFMMFPVCLITKTTISTHIANNLPDGKLQLVLLWAQLTKIYPPLPTSVQPISITKTLLIVPTKNERDPPLFTGKLLIKFQNILRNTTQVIIRHRVKILFSVISSPITLERQNWKSSKMKEILLSSLVSWW